MLIRRLDVNHDFTWGQGPGNYLSGNDAIGQNAQCRIWSFLGDCYFSLRDGIDWINLFGSRNKKVAIELAVNGTLINSEGITNVKEISVSVDTNRHISLAYSCDSIYTNINLASIQATANYLVTQDGVIITTEDGSEITV